MVMFCVEKIQHIIIARSCQRSNDLFGVLMRVDLPYVRLVAFGLTKINLLREPWHLIEYYRWVFGLVESPPQRLEEPARLAKDYADPPIVSPVN